jgi:AraC family transcriptional regulator
VGTVVWNPSGDEHEDRFGSVGARTINLELGDGWGERLEKVARVWTPAKGLEVSWLARQIVRELAHADTASALALEGLVCALIGVVSRAPAFIDRSRPAWLSRSRDRLIVEYRNPPSVAELAQQAGVHRSHYARAFRTHFGCTVAEFVRRLRIEWAAEELRQGRGTLSHVSLQAGFGDQAHFTRAFKRITGITPGEYRATVR